MISHKYYINIFEVMERFFTPLTLHLSLTLTNNPTCADSGVSCEVWNFSYMQFR